MSVSSEITDSTGITDPSSGSRHRLVLLAARAAVAAVWLYEGLWCKLLAPADRQLEIVGSLPGASSGLAAGAMTTIGIIETAFGIIVLAGWAGRRAAAMQTAALICMNVGGLVFAGGLIPDPAGMVVHNAVFIALVWVVCDAEGDGDAS